MANPKLFPNLFLGIGAMKSGTTWLYSQLHTHPSLHFTPEKELHYLYHKFVNPNQLSETARMRNARDRYLLRFDPERANIDRVRLNLHWVSAYLSNPVDDHWYRNLFPLRRHEKWACDFSNLSAQLPPSAWPQIRANCNEIRVLYTLRNPVERLWSHVRFHLQVTGETHKLDDWGKRDYRRFIQSHHVWANMEYGMTLRNLRAALAEHEMLVLFHEGIHADQRGALHRIEEFLDVRHLTYPQEALDRRPVEGLKREMPDFFPQLVEQDVARIVQEVRDWGLTPPESWMA